MTGQDMVDEMRDHEFDDLTNIRLLSLLNENYQDVCSRYLWPFLQATTTLTVDANGAMTVWPTDLAHIKSIYQTDDTTHTNLLDNDDNFYLPLGNQPILTPSFNGVAMTMVYYKTPADITLVTSPVFPSRHHVVVVFGGLARAYYMNDDLAIGQTFEQRYERRIQTMASDLLKRDVAPRKMRDFYGGY